VDSSLVGRTYPPTPPYDVTAERVAAFAAATGWTAAPGPVPATFPIVPAFEAMMAFLDAEGVDLSRVVHGEQRFRYERPVVTGDTLQVELTVASLRTIGGNDIVGTSSRVTDARGDLVCTGTATLVHRGGTPA
jgi:acyl dehydratase